MRDAAEFTAIAMPRFIPLPGGCTPADAPAGNHGLQALRLRERQPGFRAGAIRISLPDISCVHGIVTK
jgi:hypothetical protein